MLTISIFITTCNDLILNKRIGQNYLKKKKDIHVLNLFLESLANRDFGIETILVF